MTDHRRIVIVTLTALTLVSGGLYGCKRNDATSENTPATNFGAANSDNSTAANANKSPDSNTMSPNAANSPTPPNPAGPARPAPAPSTGTSGG